MLTYFAKGKKGFTLIELMIVVSIIAILAAIAIPNFMSARDRAKRASCAQSLGAIRKVMEMYLTDLDTYTGTRSRLLGYTNVTGLEAASSSVPGTDVSPVFTIVTNAAVGYTITATARDRGTTPCTARAGVGTLEDGVWCVGP